MDELEILSTYVESLLQNTSEEAALQSLKVLRNSTVKGPEFQNFIASNQALQQWLFQLLNADVGQNELQRKMQFIAWQILANTIVLNSSAREIVWSTHGETILKKCSQPPLGRHTDIQLMIVYNTFKCGTGTVTEHDVLKTIIHLWKTILSEKFEGNLDFVHFLYEHFIVEGGRTLIGYLMSMSSEERILFLNYLTRYVGQDSPNGLVDDSLLRHISKEFKKKSDCVLRQLSNEMNEGHAREVHALLRFLACASGSGSYEYFFAFDHALFLNVSGLLRCLVMAGKEGRNIFTPLNRLEEVAPASNQIPYEFESQVSFEMKTLLVRCCANLLYKNEQNQRYCLETEVMPVLFECTNMDARNPLIKEWSILAIRNACDECPEIQKIVENLTNQGAVKNDIVDELNLQMGSLRIKPSNE